MSDWIIKGNTLHISNSDIPYEIMLTRLDDTQGFRLALQTYQGKYDQEVVLIEGYLHGRNLEIFREWINRGFE